ncbi:GNAT family N-acetyltransferase [Kitasatospora sp. NPDC056138]|uniref:GNAT family N-acetyltransferase n=1 Tax=Kitasatospora sp. NPDC056138 TaxID=3345724 RepID=UPI0035E25A5E
MEHIIRAVRDEDWPKAKEIRLAALRDPLAHLAFIETAEQAAARPDDFWQDRVAGAAAGISARQFVAEAADGRWLGTVSVLVERPGEQAVFGPAPDAAQTHVVGVFVRPEARGTGIAEDLVRAALAWSWALPEPRVERVRLYVHQDNSRAEALYRKVGFERTGAFESDPAQPDLRDFELAVPRS